MTVCITAFALLSLSCAVFLFAPEADIANAANQTRSVIKATVSNLIDNEYAQKSTLKVMKDNDTFYIPESYYVEIGEKLGLLNYYNAKYAGIDVFYLSETETLENQDSIFDENEHLYPELRLYLVEGATVKVKGRQLVSDDIIKFLGFNEDDAEIYCSVSTSENETFYGFIPRTSLNTFNVPYQERTQKERELILAEQNKPDDNEGNISDGTLTPNTSLALRIVLIIGICIPAALIMVLLFKPSKDDGVKRNRRKNIADNGVDYDDSRSFGRRE